MCFTDLCLSFLFFFTKVLLLHVTCPYWHPKAMLVKTLVQRKKHKMKYRGQNVWYWMRSMYCETSLILLTVSNMFCTFCFTCNGNFYKALLIWTSPLVLRRFSLVRDHCVHEKFTRPRHWILMPNNNTLLPFLISPNELFYSRRHYMQITYRSSHLTCL